MMLGALLRRLQSYRLTPTARRVMQERLTYLSVKRLARIEYALGEIESIPGDIVEFGIALGGSGIILAHKAIGGRRFFGFDVFGMIPPPTSEKDDAKSKRRYETIKSGLSNGIAGDQYYGYKENLFGEVTQSFAAHGVPVDYKNVILCKGLFEETWPTVQLDAIALAHIDCDWYAPVAFCLDACARKLSAGGIIIIDDYNDYGGCRVAVDEFVSTHSDFEFHSGANPFLRRNRAVAPSKKPTTN